MARNRLAGILLAGIGLLTFSTPLAAHHGSAAFETDPAKQVTVKGTVTEWMWANPHCWLKLDVKDDGGKVAHWVMESYNPADLIDRGWTRQSINVGDQVTVTARPAKSGAPTGTIVHVVLSSGQILDTQLPKQ
jgi:hypothetical protein